MRIYHNGEAVVSSCAKILSSLGKSIAGFLVRLLTLEECDKIVVVDVAALGSWVPWSQDELTLCSSSESGGEGIRAGVLCVL